MQAKAINIKGVTFIGKAQSNHWITMDGPEEFQGSNAATRPKELILIGLAGSSGSDVASILSKMREKVSRFEIDMDISNAIIPFSNFFNTETNKYIYNGREQIPFENKDPEFKEIMIQEFL